MCAHMMSGQLYSAFPGMPMLLGMLLSVVLLAVVIWAMGVFLRGQTTRGRPPEPQPRDEPYSYRELHEPALQVLRERYARGEIDP